MNRADMFELCRTHCQMKLLTYWIMRLDENHGLL